MKALCFTAELITPLVIAGADNRKPDLKQEGLRPPSLRGAMRWWFRAMMGGIVGSHDHYNTLRELEGSLFGNTERKAIVQTRTKLNGDTPIGDAYLRMNDHDKLRLDNGRVVAAPKRLAIEPTTSFQLALRIFDPRGVQVALGSLWLVAMLSGIGARDRRGFGSLSLSPLDDLTEQVIAGLDLSLNYSGSLADICAGLSRDLTQIQSLFNHYASNGPIAAIPDDFSILCGRTAKCFLITPQSGFWGTWQESMDDLRNNVYRAFKTAIGEGRLGSGKPRHPSPLHIQIKRTSSGGHFGLLLAFKSEKYFGPSWSTLTSFLGSLTGYDCRGVTLP